MSSTSIDWTAFEKLEGGENAYEIRKAWLRENVPGYAESQDKYQR